MDPDQSKGYVFRRQLSEKVTRLLQVAALGGSRYDRWKA